MRTITYTDSQAVAGGFAPPQALAIGAAALVGGYATSKVTDFMGPAFTVLGTVGGCIGGTALGTVIIPIPIAGTLIGAGLGAFVGYCTTSFFANMTGFAVGGAAAGALAYSQLMV